MRKTRGQIGSRVMRGVVRLGQHSGHRHVLLPTIHAPVRPDPAVASRVAGALGVSALGVEYVDRLSHYQEQNGPPYKTSPRQRRRLEHKAHHQEAKARRAIANRRTDEKVATLRAAVRGAR